jgi:hypothetical protein
VLRSLVIACVLSACWREAVAPSSVVHEPAAKPMVGIVDPPMTRAMARAVIARLSPTDRATLGELWLMYELQDLIGNEDEPQKLLHRLETEFAHPLVANPAAMRDALAEARKTLPIVAATNISGYDQAAKVGEPVLTLILSPAEIERRIAAYPPEIGAAWLVEQYFADDHYHDYNMKNRLWDLVTSTYGRRALALVEDRLRESEPEGSNSTAGEKWKASTAAGRAILGREFPAWYRKIRGTSYREDLETSRGAEGR